LAILSGCIDPRPAFPSAISTTASATPTSSAASAEPIASGAGDPTGALATPTPTLPPDPLPTTAAIEHDGVRVTIELERNPMPAGEPTWVTTTVTNTGRDDLIWFHDGCAISVGVNGQLVNARYLVGDSLPAPFQTMKGYLLDLRANDDGNIWVGFTPEQFVGKGTIACSDVGIGDRVRPGASIRQRAQWNGLGYLYGPPPPTGSVDLVGSFRYYWRTKTGEPEDITKQVMDVHLPTWLIGRSDTLLDPGEAVDAALADPRLPGILDRLDLHNANERYLRYDLATATYAIGVLIDRDPPQTPSTLHTAIVDAHSGDVVDFVERVWDWQKEGNP
jgi:hypothetical protein